MRQWKKSKTCHEIVYCKSNTDLTTLENVNVMYFERTLPVKVHGVMTCVHHSKVTFCKCRAKKRSQGVRHHAKGCMALRCDSSVTCDTFRSRGSTLLYVYLPPAWISFNSPVLVGLIWTTRNLGGGGRQNPPKGAL
jgi:hypothetical protein